MNRLWRAGIFGAMAVLFTVLVFVISKSGAKPDLESAATIKYDSTAEGRQSYVRIKAPYYAGYCFEVGNGKNGECAMYPVYDAQAKDYVLIAYDISNENAQKRTDEALARLNEACYEKDNSGITKREGEVLYGTMYPTKYFIRWNLSQLEEEAGAYVKAQYELSGNRELIGREKAEDVRIGEMTLYLDGKDIARPQAGTGTIIAVIMAMVFALASFFICAVNMVGVLKDGR